MTTAAPPTDAELREHLLAQVRQYPGVYSRAPLLAAVAPGGRYVAGARAVLNHLIEVGEIVPHTRPAGSSAHGARLYPASNCSCRGPRHG